jgi:fucose permease
MLGVAWPRMREAIDAPLAGLGVLIAAFTAAYFVSTGASGPLAGRLGTRTLAVAAAVLAAAGLAAFAATGSWATAIAAALLVGLGGGALDAGINAYVAVTGGVRAMGLLHASWALGAALGPALVGAGEATSTWRASYLAAALAFAATALLLVLLPPAVRRAIEPVPSGSGPSASAFVAFAAAMFIVNVGLESVVGQWAFVDLSELRGVSGATAGSGVTLFFAALAAGRVALGVGGHRVSLQRELDASVVLTMAGAIGYWLLPPAVAAIVALPVLGVGLSVFIPVILVLLPERIGAGATANAVGVQFAAGTVGGGGFPPAVGVLMQTLAVPVLGPVVTLLAAALAALHLEARRR